MELLEALKEMKRVVFENINETDDSFDVDTFISKLATETHLEESLLVLFYNAFLVWKLENEKHPHMPKKKLWTRGEMTILIKYTEHLRNVRSKVSLLRDMAEVLDRTETAVSYTYYNVDKYPKPIDHEKEFDLFEGKEESAPTTPQVTGVSIANKQEESTEDFLDMLTNILGNFEQLEGFDVTGFFKGLNTLSELAAKHTGENDKLKQEKEQLQQDVSQLRGQLNSISRLFKEFNGYNSIDQIKNMREFRQKIENML